jgi:hypothetical protein
MHKTLPGTSYNLPFEVKLSSQQYSFNKSGSVEKTAVVVEDFMNPKLIMGQYHDLVTKTTT